MYDCIIVGGGIAGLQAAIQLGRYGRNVMVIDAGEGRSLLCHRYGNILGYPDGVDGAYLREVGRAQAESYGTRFVADKVVRAARLSGGEGFRVFGESTLREGEESRALLLATGIADRFPELPGLRECFGISVYICPDCDGYEVRGKRTVVLGAGDAGARMALTLTYYTDELIFVNHEKELVREDLREKLAKKQIEVVNESAAEIVQANGGFNGIRLSGGKVITGDKAFIAFGGNKVKSDLASDLGAERLESRHIVTDPRTKMTSVRGLWAAGDIGVHSEQLVIAMAEGHQAAIWMHKYLMEKGFKRPYQEKSNEFVMS
ncbi:NAD(P)/FAD-dependent oxidoreductase [Paenibacillus turpanensis]|uniref:NAD(P)/FAD-dependent oxidoreductase n=1 Tax=Paenibacillus turpanensis TaxID=2689078 RepID=UPI00140BD5D3|nr:NAD(P)/FAD-dependent oxidoreductase [Paenibacillus turpanensis]